MPKRLPIATARAVGKRHPDIRQVILIAWDGKATHVVTWGRSVDDCAQAAHGGNLAKVSFGFPEELCREEPHRVKKLKERIAELERAVASQEPEDR